MDPQVQEYFRLIGAYLEEKYAFPQVTYTVGEEGFGLSVSLTEGQAARWERQAGDLPGYVSTARWFAADQLRVPMDQVPPVRLGLEDRILRLYGAPPVLTALLLQVFDDRETGASGTV